MKWIDDKTLTESQQKLKWYLYCEVEMEQDIDIEAVLESLLRDVKVRSHSPPRREANESQQGKQSEGLSAS
jgi:hypothetical protein